MKKSDLRIQKKGLEITIRGCNKITRDFISKIASYDAKSDAFCILPYNLPLLINFLSEHRVPYKSNVNLNFRMEDLELKLTVSLHPHQRKALDAIVKKGYRGILVMPTGAGKTIIALAVIAKLQVKTLIVVPTIDLLYQWKGKLIQFLNLKESNVGIYGGGEREIRDITVATYQGASTERFLLKAIDFYGLIIFDEVHHLSSKKYSEIARRLVAPYRIGLTATLDMEEKRKETLEELVGNVLEVTEIDELILEGYLADYEYKIIRVNMTKFEREKYLKAIKCYREYLQMEAPHLKGKEAYLFVIKKSKFDEYARRAIEGLRKAREIALFPKQKIITLESLLKKHREDKVLIFTRNVKTANMISYIFAVPKITHDTPKSLRRKFLALFREGKLTKIVTAEVLDEGIDVPDASVCIIISGRASKRQLIQRIGRVLRPREGKKAIIYELITSSSLEEKIAAKRKK